MKTMSEHRRKFERAIGALSLELPAAVYRDFCTVADEYFAALSSAPPDLVALVREADLDAQLMANALYNIPHRVQADGSVRWEGRDSDHLRDLRLKWETSSQAMRVALAAWTPAPPVAETPTTQPCVIGVYCQRHQFIHGAEAEELRERLERLVAEDGNMEVQAVLDQVDARDSCAYLEAVDENDDLPASPVVAPAPVVEAVTVTRDLNAIDLALGQYLAAAQHGKVDPDWVALSAARDAVAAAKRLRVALSDGGGR